eukprot:COSAG06_NODE_11436_length_1510_cov_14.272147_1_plen_295_part_01
MPKRDTSRRDRRRADDGASLSRSARTFDSDAAGGRSHSNGDQHEHYDVDLEQGRHAHSTAERGGGGDTSRHEGNSGRSPTLSPDRSSARADQPLASEVHREMPPRTQIVDEEEPTSVRKMASVVRRTQTVNEAASEMNDSAGIDDAVPKDDGVSPSRSARPFDSGAARGRSHSSGDRQRYYEYDIEHGRHAQQPRGHGHSMAGRGGGGDTSRHGGNSGRSPTLSPDRSSTRADQPLSHEMSRELSPRTQAMAEQEPLPVRTMASLARQTQAVNKAAGRMKDAAGIDDGVPKDAFM